MSHVAIDSTVEQRPGVVSRVLGGEAILVDLESGLYFGLDEVGTAIWEELGVPRQLETVAEVISVNFAVSREEAASDLLAFTADLVTRGLLRVVPPT